MALYNSVHKIASRLPQRTLFRCHTQQKKVKRTFIVGNTLSKQNGNTELPPVENRSKYWWREWDGSIDPGDETDIAFETLDITKLKPHPEYRNVAAGLILDIHDDPHKNIWSKWENYLDELIKEDDKMWEEYVQKHGHTPVEYFKTADYTFTYEDLKIWQTYKRNFKGGRQKQITRRNCFSTNRGFRPSACPLCRDEKIKILYNNKPLLLHFIDPLSNEIYPALRTGVCRVKQARLEHTIKLARNLGILEVPVKNIEQNLNDYRLDHPALAKW